MSPERHPHASAINLQTGARIALFGLAINVMLASVKMIAGFFGNAYVLIADGIESAMDVGGSIVIWGGLKVAAHVQDRKSTRLNSSHVRTSYAVFCLKKKTSLRKGAGRYASLP